MPPFSRGASHVLFPLRARHLPSSYTSRALQSKALPKHPSRTRPTKLQAPPPARPKPSFAGGSSPPERVRRLRYLDVLALLRLSIATSSATFFHQLHERYKRLPRPIRNAINFVYLLGIVFALVIPPGMVFRNHFYDIVRVTGPSMSPYLNTDFEDGATDVHDITKSTDRILLNLYSPRENLRRGMVVAFRTPHDPEKWAIKRIVALQGDRVFPLPHYPGLESLNGKGLIVPFGHIWLEGDVSDEYKKDASVDSNIYGPVTTGLVIGKATHVITSFLGRWTAIDSNHFKLPERVQIDAMDLQDLDQEYQSKEFEEMFQNGKAADILEILRKRLQEQGGAEKCRQNPDLVDTFSIIRIQAQRQLSKHDSQTSELATNLVTLADEVLGK
jgi:mitochondrial inner membrane protease subunit 2